MSKQGAAVAGSLEEYSSYNGQENLMIRCLSPSSSTCSGPEGFKNKKIELIDGRLVVSEDSGFDSACTSVKGSFIEDWEHVYSTHRSDIVDNEGFIFTPLHIIKTWAFQFKKEFHVEHFILKNTTQTKAIYRVDILFDSIRGVGQCSRKQLARQLAAIDVYEKIQLQQAELGYRPNPIPRCGLLPGWRIGSMVYPILFKDVCQQKDLDIPSFQIIPPPENKLGQYTVICRVGGHVTKAKNDHPWLAKKLAAKTMFEKITGEEFPMEITLTGNEVIGFPQMKLLGFKPKITDLKRKWMMQHRIKETQVVVPSTEPADGEMDEFEEEVQMEQSKKVKLSELKESLKITIHREIKSSNDSSCKIIPVSPVKTVPTDIRPDLAAIKQWSKYISKADVDQIIAYKNDNEKMD